MTRCPSSPAVWCTLAQEYAAQSKCVDVVLACRDPHPALLVEAGAATTQPSGASSHGQHRMHGAEGARFVAYPSFPMTFGGPMTGNVADDDSPQQATRRMPLRSSVIFNTRHDALGAEIGTDLQDVEVPRRSGRALSATGVSSLYLLEVFAGMYSEGKTPSGTSYSEGIDLDDLVRQVTESQQALCTASQEPYELDPLGEKPCHFAALDSVWPCLDVFSINTATVRRDSASTARRSSGWSDMDRWANDDARRSSKGMSGVGRRRSDDEKEESGARKRMRTEVSGL